MATASISQSISCVDSHASALATYNGNPGLTGTTTLASTQITTGVYQATNTISTATTITLNNGSISNAYGQTLTYTTVQAIVLVNTSASANIVVGSGTHALLGSDSYTVQAGKTLIVPNMPITISSTVNQITLTPSASATYSLMIVG